MAVNVGGCLLGVDVCGCILSQCLRPYFEWQASNPKEPFRTLT